MMKNYSHLDEDLLPDEKEEYQDLISHLTRNRKFGLYFVQSTPLDDEKIITKIIHDLPNKKVEVLRLIEPIDTLYERVLELYINQQFDVLLITGLEHSLYQYEQENFGQITEDKFSNLTKVPHILNHLNQKRELFRDNIPISFVFLARPFLISYFIYRAPDFWDWRSALLEIGSINKFISMRKNIFSSDCQS
ncbi:hypothetical protein [Trichormus azollae]|jgi:hypothetical protein|uniref:hypothetical protein n=1 Tax=Trichormus azollae TaxID=1164 RepID=UPI00325ED2BF